MENTSIKGVFNIKYKCKHSVRFDAYKQQVADELAKAIYISNDAYSELGRPDEIVVEVSLLTGL